jgi:SMC interacting uncharacterized protein involved in chromosome segregation
MKLIKITVIKHPVNLEYIHTLPSYLIIEGKIVHDSHVREYVIDYIEENYSFSNVNYRYKVIEEGDESYNNYLAIYLKQLENRSLQLKNQIKCIEHEINEIQNQLDKFL